MALAIRVCFDSIYSSYICSVRSVMHKHLDKMGEVNFDKIFNQKLGE